MFPDLPQPAKPSSTHYYIAPRRGRLIVVVSDNRAVDELLPVVRSLGDLTGAVSPDAVIGLPAYDVLPFENLSPHPEIQEARATALWKIATGAASVVITPLAATAMRCAMPSFTPTWLKSCVAAR